MNCKKKVNSRSLRLFILRRFSFVPDKWMIKLQYRLKLGVWPNLSKPVRFTEKLQCYKLYYKNPLMIRCVDKFDVRSYIEELGFGHILINCIGIYDNPSLVDFNTLPDKFVLKDTLAGGGTSVIVVKDKSKLDTDAVFQQMQAWTHLPYNKPDGGREWPYYSGKPHRIIIEDFLESDSEEGLQEYKFFCFNGKIGFIYAIKDRIIGEGVKLGIFDSSLNRMEGYRTDERVLDDDFDFPSNIQEMMSIAESLSKGFPEIRIDLYSVKGKVYFGELTFFDGSGYMRFKPDGFDEKLGQYMDVSSFMR